MSNNNIDLNTNHIFQNLESATEESIKLKIKAQLMSSSSINESIKPNKLKQEKTASITGSRVLDVIQDKNKKAAPLIPRKNKSYNLTAKSQVMRKTKHP